MNMSEALDMDGRAHADGEIPALKSFSWLHIHAKCWGNRWTQWVTWTMSVCVRLNQEGAPSNMQNIYIQRICPRP